MTVLLSIAEWRAEHIRFCPKCEQDTMPLWNGTCGFCDSQIVLAAVTDQRLPVGFGDGFCRLCGEPFDMPPFGGQGKKYCCRAHGKKFWEYYTAKGQATAKRRKERRDARRKLFGREAA